MKQNWIRITLYGCFVSLLVACSQVSAPPLSDETLAPQATPSPSVDTQTEPEPATLTQEFEMTRPTPSSGMESLIEKAKEDLAQRLSIAMSQISLVEAKEVVWPNSSMGCPQPGMLYKQVPYDGALIILELEGKTFEYHVGGSRGLFLCEMVYKDPSTPPKLDITNLTPSTRNNNLTPPTPDNSIPPGEGQ